MSNDIELKDSEAVDTVGVCDSVEKEGVVPVKISRVVHMLDDNNTGVVLSVLNRITGLYDEETILLTELNPSVLGNLLARKGYINVNVKLLCSHIKKQISEMLNITRNASVILSHRTLGWHGGQFKADKIYGVDEVIDSTYTGMVSIESDGTLDAFVEMLKECVQSNVAMEAICAMAASATVLPFANSRWGVSISNPVIHFVGTSSMGKTTATFLFVAFGSAPEETGSLLLTYMSTENALLGQIGKTKGYPIAIDELSTAGRKALTQLVYTLSNGQGRARCTAGGLKIEGDNNFSTVFLSNGEASLTAHCSKTEGIKARLFEFTNVAWTRSASEASMIKAVAKANFGKVTPLVAQELLRNGDDWKPHFEDWCKSVKRKMQDDKIILGVGDRISEVVALFMTSAEILNSVLKVEFDISGIFDFLYDYMIFKNAEEINLGTRAYSAIIRHYARNRDRFVDEVSASMMPLSDILTCQQDMEGVVVDSTKVHRDVQGNRYDRYIVFYPDVLEKILKDNGFIEPKVVLRAMHKEGLLRTKDSKRDYMIVCLEGVETRVFAVWIRDFTYTGYDAEDNDEDILE